MNRNRRWWRFLLTGLLVVQVTGGPPAALLSFESAAPCGKMCTRCRCKRHEGATHMRPACACCRPLVPGVVSAGDDGLAVLPLPAALPVDLPAREPRLASPAGLSSFLPTVPHPPPRASTAR